jgi:hypothetical protein
VSFDTVEDQEAWEARFGIPVGPYDEDDKKREE